MPLSLTDHRLAPVMAAAGPLDPDKRIVLMERIVASLKRLLTPSYRLLRLAGGRSRSFDGPDPQARISKPASLP